LAVAPAPARPRPGGGRLFIIVGLLLAILAGAGVFLLGGALGGGGGIGGATTTVVIAKQAIPGRHFITEADVDTMKVSGNLINTYSNKGDLINLVTQIQIAKGVIITSDMLGRDVSLISGGAPAYLPLPKGYVAMTIPTGEQQGVAGHITVGDYITIISSASINIFNTGGVQAPGPPKIVSKTIFTNVRIIALGPAAANIQPASGGTSVGGVQGQTSGITSSLTVELTQCDAEFMVWFLNNTSLKYTVESNQDYLAQAPSGPDASCPTIQTAQGVSQREVEARYHFTAL
jgi:Flp pilus assembly protein CpaB